MSYDCENLCVPIVESILLSSHYCNRAEGTNFAGAAGAESRPNWYTGTSEQTKMYVFVGVLAGTVGAADNTLWRILSGAGPVQPIHGFHIGCMLLFIWVSVFLSFSEAPEWKHDADKQNKGPPTKN